METPVRSQQNTSIWQQSDHNKTQVFGNTSQITTNYKSTSQITTKYKYLETPVRSQKYASILKHQSNHKKIRSIFHNEKQVFGLASQITTKYMFGNTSRITTNCKYLETVRSQQKTSTWKQLDHNEIEVF